MPTLRIPMDSGEVTSYTTGEPSRYAPPEAPLAERVAYAAVHVVADPLADNTPGRPARLDWDATLAYRHYLWRYGLGVAEAMDTAQRGMGLDWPATRELIRRAAADARTVGGTIACGAGTDQLPARAGGLDEVIAGYEAQVAAVEDAGARVILMASRQLAALARGPEDYARVYGRLLDQARDPVILHWLGPMFDAALAGYWGAEDLDAATTAFVELVGEHAAKVDGVKVSLLDADREIALRRRLPAGVRCYTGDDFNYPDLIAGDDAGHSDALLGVFDAIGPAASAALRALDRGDRDAYHRIFAPTVPLARHVFAAPTYNYKTGVVFLAWLAGHQDHFTMVAGLQSARSVPHLAHLFALADRAGLLPDPELAAQRMRRFLALAGVEQ